MFGHAGGPLIVTRDLVPDPRAGAGLAPRPIGRATVERMLGDTFAKVKHESDKAVWVGAAALTAILVVGGGTYIYQRQNATEANQQALENQQLIQQMGQDVKKTPEVAEAMRQEVIRLNNQLQLSDARNAERLRALSRELTEQQAAARQEQLAAARQAVRELAGQPQGGAAPAPAGAPQRSRIRHPPRPRRRRRPFATRVGNSTMTTPCAGVSTFCKTETPPAP